MWGKTGRKGEVAAPPASPPPTMTDACRNSHFPPLGFPPPFLSSLSCRPPRLETNPSSSSIVPRIRMNGQLCHGNARRGECVCERDRQKRESGSGSRPHFSASFFLPPPPLTPFVRDGAGKQDGAAVVGAIELGVGLGGVAVAGGIFTFVIRDSKNESQIYKNRYNTDKIPSLFVTTAARSRARTSPKPQAPAHRGRVRQPPHHHCSCCTRIPAGCAAPPD